MPRKSIHEYVEESHDHDHEEEIDVEKQMEAAREDFFNQLRGDEEMLRLVTALAGGRDRWKKLLGDRINGLEDIIGWNEQSIDPLLELYELYLEEPSDETMMQFNVLESRRLIMRDFFITKTLLARIGADINNISKRLAKIEKKLELK